MSGEQRHCENCRWARSQPLTDGSGQPVIGQQVRICHRFPPTAVLVPAGGNAANLTAMFPPVDRSMFCSLHDFPSNESGTGLEPTAHSPALDG